MTEVTPNLPHCGNFGKYCFMGTLLQLNTAVLQAYEAKLEQMAERGSVGRASISDQLKAGKAAAEQAKAERTPKEKPSRGAER